MDEICTEHLLHLNKTFRHRFCFHIGIFFQSASQHSNMPEGIPFHCSFLGVLLSEVQWRIQDSQNRGGGGGARDLQPFCKVKLQKLRRWKAWKTAQTTGERSEPQIFFLPLCINFTARTVFLVRFLWFSDTFSRITCPRAPLCIAPLSEVPKPPDERKNRTANFYQYERSGAKISIVSMLKYNNWVRLIHLSTNVEQRTTNIFAKFFFSKDFCINIHSSWSSENTWMKFQQLFSNMSMNNWFNFEGNWPTRLRFMTLWKKRTFFGDYIL